MGKCCAKASNHTTTTEKTLDSNLEKFTNFSELTTGL